MGGRWAMDRWASPPASAPAPPMACAEQGPEQGAQESPDLACRPGPHFSPRAASGPLAVLVRPSAIVKAMHNLGSGPGWPSVSGEEGDLVQGATGWAQTQQRGGAGSVRGWLPAVARGVGESCWADVQ